MKLKVLDQISISSLQPDSLRPGQEINVSAAFGAELVKVHPGKFTVLEAGETEAEPEPDKKAEPEPDNKAELAAPANKAITGRKAKTKA